MPWFLASLSHLKYRFMIITIFFLSFPCILVFCVCCVLTFVMVVASIFFSCALISCLESTHLYYIPFCASSSSSFHSSSHPKSNVPYMSFANHHHLPLTSFVLWTWFFCPLSFIHGSDEHTQTNIEILQPTPVISSSLPALCFLAWFCHFLRLFLLLLPLNWWWCTSNPTSSCQLCLPFAHQTSSPSSSQSIDSCLFDSTHFVGIPVVCADDTAIWC